MHATNVFFPVDFALEILPELVPEKVSVVVFRIVHHYGGYARNDLRGEFLHGIQARPDAGVRKDCGKICQRGGIGEVQSRGCML